MSKLFHLSGHIAKHPCRTCNLEGTPYKIPFKTKKGQQREKTQYYYPLHPPVTGQAPQMVINTDHLLYRTHDGYIADGNASHDNPLLAVETGVKGVSPLVLTLETISFPESTPFDIMHLVFLGFVRVLCALLSGKFFQAKDLNNHDGRMSETDWVQLGVDMANIRAPVSSGRRPRNIEKYVKGFKAEELSNFLTIYLLPLVFKRVNHTTYRALQRLVLAISLAMSFELTFREIMEFERQMTLFIQWFYDTYYQGKYERLPVCKYTIHGLLHLARDIQNWGSASYFWQFPEVHLY